MSNPACPSCGHTEHVIKSGLNHTKSQRYRCQACRRYFTVERKSHGYDLALRKQALRCISRAPVSAPLDAFSGSIIKA